MLRKGSKGIGRGIVMGFASEHCRIVTVARTLELLEEVAEEALEKGAAAIGDAGSAQPFVSNGRLSGRLGHDGGQLLVVANEDELVDGEVTVSIGGTEEGQQMGL